MVCLPIPPLRRGRLPYFFSGGGGVAGGVLCCCCGAAGCAGCCCCCCCCCCFCLAPSRTTDDPPGREIKMVRASDVIMKITAAVVVALLRRVPAPRAPKAVCEPPPPKAPAQSAPLPCCKSTTMIRKMQTIT